LRTPKETLETLAAVLPGAISLSSPTKSVPALSLRHRNPKTG
jgi:hypothetical protein